MQARTPTALPDLSSTPATKMLAAGLERLQAEQGLTQRDIAKRLGYKTSVVLSHMASGRVPIPIDRALGIADVVGLDHSRFLLAVLAQRYPEIKFEELLGIRLVSRGKIAQRLELLAGCDLDDLGEDVRDVLDEVVVSSQPKRRWLSIEELALVELLRRRYPSLETRPLAASELQALEACLEAAGAGDAE